MTHRSQRQSPLHQTVFQVLQETLMSAPMSKLRALGGSRLGAHPSQGYHIIPQVPLLKTLPSLPGVTTSTVHHDVPAGRLRHRVCAAVPPDIPGNLGNLSRIASGADDLSWSLDRVSPESFANRGLYVDPVIALTSGFLLILLLALSFQRILGLDRLVAEFMLAQQEKRRQNTRDAKQLLERSWKSQEGKGSQEDKEG